MFAANSGTNNIVVVNTVKREISNTVGVGKDPCSAALTPDGRFVYSDNLADNPVSVMDVDALKAVAAITGFKQPRPAIVVTRDRKRA